MKPEVTKNTASQKGLAGWLWARRKGARSATDIKGVLAGPMMAGTLVAIVFFGIFGTWAATAPIAGGAMAPGVISPLGSRRTVQHLEGGIIEQILVRDGDVVQKDEPLLILATTQAEASFKVYLDQRRTMSAMIARLEAEQLGASEITYPDWLLATGDEVETQKSLATQQALFLSRAESLEGRKEVQRRRIAQLEEEIQGLKGQIAAQREQIALINEEIEDVEGLLKKGLERASRLLALKRTRAEIRGHKAENEAAIARANQAIGEAETQILNTLSEHRSEVAKELNALQYELNAINEKMVASQDVLARTTLTAPVAGTIVNKRFVTTGGVIGPGEPVMDIVPMEEDLIIETRISPLDIDLVRKGLEAQVHLSAYSQRKLPQIHGKVRAVSADSLQDPVTGEAYFKVEVEVDRSELEEIEAAFDVTLDLSPGMPADVLVVTGERTMLAYLLDPFTSSVRKSFREM